MTPDIVIAWAMAVTYVAFSALMVGLVVFAFVWLVANIVD